MENLDKAVSKPIKHWAPDDQPREKMMRKGAAALSNSELLAILIGSGRKEKSAIDISKEILRMGNDNLNELGKLSLKSFQKIKGIGLARAVAIAAALELGRRRNSADLIEKISVKNSGEVARYLQVMLKDYRHEVFAVLYLNRANKVRNFEIVSQGGMTGTVADPRVILKRALEEEATSIILCHNHPSGNLKPSRADKELTIKIKQAASYLDIIVLDHIIVSEEGYFSFADEGLI
ncbi:DNA repair protein RadC [Ferruginibacter sp. HRS2-29]|uniref:RadC family protein n=1 Tax=Ferruginibacter sp. HRS2-29 TaxID=2487334 RepID=UPI0020CC0BE6|nr:DNA repair protein RadC [Ferruginibacter sp. HRS2-29]MCP9753313.1 JAB domain-containing protein [Ferruginibacter sp. HRS2-29]